MRFHRILGWLVSDLLTHIGRLELVDVDLDKEPQCEGLTHPQFKHGHDGGPAKYNIVFHCECGPFPILACAGRAAKVRRSGARCSTCDIRIPPDAIRFIEL